MRYNLSPLDQIVYDMPNGNIWKERFNSFFSRETSSPDLVDEYYDHLLSDLTKVRYVLSGAMLIDENTGLFSIGTPEVEAAATFNMAYYVVRRYQTFSNSSILTMVGDYGIINNQLRFSGIELVNSLMDQSLKTGSILTCIGNGSYPYNINKKVFKKYDTIIASCVFQTDDAAYENWQFLLDERTKGIEVYLISNTFYHLRNHINYDRLEMLEDPTKVFDKEEYADLSAGYANRIYKLK